MSKTRFNQLFVAMMLLGLVGSLFISPAVTGRAKGKEELLLYPIIKPVRVIASMLRSKYGHKEFPPGETTVRKDPELAAENSDLRQQIVFLTRQLEDLQLVESERKHLGKLLEYFKPVSVIAGDASPGRESLTILPSSGVDVSPGSPVMGADGLVGRMADGRRVRLITDKDFTVTGHFGRWENGQWQSLATPKPSVRGIGNGQMRIDNLTNEDAKGLRAGDWVVVADTTDYPPIMQERQIGQIDSIRAMTSKPLFAEIIVKPRTDLRTLKEVLLMRKTGN
ncbi:MAG: rod shape-determining protein MreC [Phycisphaerales bacterium]|nr:rod shape-determining protein MreC [Phycisphaerales bacterium]